MAPEGRIPQHAAVRAARLAKMPLSLAGRAALGLGRRLGGASAEQVQRELQERTAAELFQVLGELKGGAMKVGQQLSLFEAAVPEHLAEPFRAALTQLQDQAPPRPLSEFEPVLRASLGPGWRAKFDSFEETAASAASIGQVHRARWHDGREVAVKMQYPGAAGALRADLRQLDRLSRVLGPLLPGMDLGPLIAELSDRMLEELDYRREAWTQEAFHAVYDGDPQILVPAVIDHGPGVLVSEWVDGEPLNRLIARGAEADRAVLERLAPSYIAFLLGAPERAGLLHADPHPGNFLHAADGRLAVLDFGAADRLPDGLPIQMGRLLSIALRADSETLLDGLREEGFVRDAVQVDAAEVLAILEPLIAPCRQQSFVFTREWLREISAEIGDPRGGAFRVALKLNLPPHYVLIHRVWLGGTAVLCQMGVEIATRDVVSAYVPGLDLPELA